MFLGIFFIISACACWGLVFLIPKLLPHFSPIEIALGRFFFFGVASFIYLLLKKRYLLQRSYLPIWIKGAWFAFISNLLSYTFAVFCIRYADSAVAALIFGMCPITIALYGNWLHKEFSYGALKMPLLLMVLGIVFTNYHALQFSADSYGVYFIGVLFGLLSLCTWTWFTVTNAHFIAEKKELPMQDWVVILGVATLALVLVAFFAISFTDGFTLFASHPKFKYYIFGTVTLGIVSSWFATFFWNLGNKRLPITLAGPLTVFEMIFGLLYVYGAEGRLPSWLETLGISLMMLGVTWGFRKIHQLSTNVENKAL